ncbi:hypothetical protein RI367_007642 [Sorochytrium milnesiophthora]
MQPQSLLLALAMLVASAVALPGGAPACAVNADVIRKGMGDQTGDRQFKITVDSMTYTPGMPINIKVESDNPSTKTHKGLLLYVEPANNAKQRIGKFVIPQGFKSNVDKCAPKGIAAGTDSIITHNSPADKMLDMPIQWTPDSNMGDIVVRAAVVGTGPTNWQIVTPITLKAAGGSSSAPASGSMYGGSMPSSSYGNGQPMRRCKKWRHKKSGGYGYGAMPATTVMADAAPASAAATTTMDAGYGSGAAMPTSMTMTDSAAPAATSAVSDSSSGYGSNGAAAGAAGASGSATDSAAASAAATSTPAADQASQGQQAAASTNGADAGVSPRALSTGLVVLAATLVTMLF